MPFTIDVQNEHNYPVDVARLAVAAEAVLQAHDVDANSSLSVVISDDEQVRRLNLQFRGVDAVTDVLSFPADDPYIPEGEDESEPTYWGDIIIAYAFVSRQAEAGGFSLADNLLLMVVHGNLHLLGYDHDTAENRAEMWESQADVLRELGVPLAIVPTLESYEH